MTFRFEDFLPASIVNSAVLSPDGARVAFTTMDGGTSNLHLLEIDSGTTRQLTHFTHEAVRELDWHPNSRLLTFLADHDGDEYHHLYLLDTSDPAATPRKLTTKDGVQRHFYNRGMFSPDGSTLACTMGDDDPVYPRVALFDVVTGEHRYAPQTEAFTFHCAWLPDGRIAVCDDHSNTDVRPLILDTVTDAVTPLLPQFNGSITRLYGPTAQGTLLAVSNGGDREFLNAAELHPETQELSWFDEPHWDINPNQVRVSGDGRTVFYLVNEGGRSVLHARTTHDWKPMELPTLPTGTLVDLSVNRTGSVALVLCVPEDRPATLLLLDIPAGTCRTLLQSTTRGTNLPAAIAPEEHRTVSFDGLEVPVWVWKPAGEGPHPVVIDIHGGPEAQYLSHYKPLTQCLLANGIGVIAPNVRGSTGYGSSYQKRIHHDWGGDEVRDFEAVHQYTTELPWVDSSRIAVYGGSYGGFAVLTCLARLPHLNWACGVDIVGVANLVTFIRSVPESWKPFMDGWVGNPDTEYDWLMARSPISYVDQITAPLYVVQGANDPRVVKAESDQIVESIRARGGDVRYDVYEDEGHGFAKEHNLVRCNQDVVDYLAAKLGVGARAEAGTARV